MPLNLEKDIEEINSSGLHTSTQDPHPREITIEFKPKKTITAYELASLMPYLTGVAVLTDIDWEALGKKVTRHLIKHE